MMCCMRSRLTASRGLRRAHVGDKVGLQWGNGSWDQLNEPYLQRMVNQLATDYECAMSLPSQQRWNRINRYSQLAGAIEI